MVGSPPEICTRSGSPSLATRASNMRSTSARLRWVARRGEESAQHTGQARLQASLISTIATQVPLVIRTEAAIPRAAALGAVPGASGRSPGFRYSSVGANRPDRRTPASSSRRARRSAWSNRCGRSPRRSWPAPARGRSRKGRLSGRGRDKAPTCARYRRYMRPPGEAAPQTDKNGFHAHPCHPGRSNGFHRTIRQGPASLA